MDAGGFPLWLAVLLGVFPVVIASAGFVYALGLVRAGIRHNGEEIRRVEAKGDNRIDSLKRDIHDDFGRLEKLIAEHLEATPAIRETIAGLSAKIEGMQEDIGEVKADVKEIRRNGRHK